MSSEHEQRILAAWQTNARPWIDAVRQSSIRAAESITSNAILAVIQDFATAGGSILDAGCGEGWLVRKLTHLGYQAMGTDAVPELIEYAEQQGEGIFTVATYEHLKAAKLGQFDMVVCNFALLGDSSTTAFVEALPALLNPQGVCIIQTLHPVAFSRDGEYADGWKAGTWAGLPGNFGEPAPWYFRTLAGWLNLFSSAGAILREVREPSIDGEFPRSIIFVIENT